jgi:hypothetical protein
LRCIQLVPSNIGTPLRAYLSPRIILSAADFVTKSENEYHKIAIEQSSVGYTALLGPGASIFLASSYHLCHMQTHFSTTRYLDLLRDCGISVDECWLRDYVQSRIRDTPFFIRDVVNSVWEPRSSVWVAIPAFVCALILQSLSRTLVPCIFQFLMLSGPKKTQSHCLNYISAVWYQGICTSVSLVSSANSSLEC